MRLDPNRLYSPKWTAKARRVSAESSLTPFVPSYGVASPRQGCSALSVFVIA
jgi:hypothetical protein